MESFLVEFFNSLAAEFIETKDNKHRFIVKASLSYGPIIHGRDIPDAANMQFKDNPEYRKSILIGLPMIQAFTHEKNAPPWGVYVHESARSFSSIEEKPFGHKWFKWFMGKHPKTNIKTFQKSVEEYFSYAVQNQLTLDYPDEKIAYHKSMFDEYSQSDAVDNA